MIFNFLECKSNVYCQNVRSLGKGTLLAVVAVAGIAAFFVLRQFFPLIIEQIVAGILAFFVFLAGLIFKRKKGNS